jgi:hypothetical protein
MILWIIRLLLVSKGMDFKKGKRRLANGNGVWAWGRIRCIEEL